MNESLGVVKKALVDVDLAACLAAIELSLESGVSSWEIVDGSLAEGMREVGDLFEAGEYFLGELVMAGNIMKEAMVLLKGGFDKTVRSKRGKVILATVQGDMHDLGKNLVGMMLDAAGFEVIDLGVDVPAGKIIETAQNTGARAVGLTMLLTPGIDSMREVRAAIQASGLKGRVHVAIGGAATSQRLADQMGFEAYGENAVKAVRIFERLLGA
jgi:methanogenic corrinoid protein MtbC1